MKFKLSINRNLINKDDPTKPGWENTEFTPDMLIEHIRSGYAFSQGVLRISASSKKPAIADISQAILLPIDIDNTTKVYNPTTKKYDERIMTIQEGYLPLDIAMADPWLHDNALLIYTTPSHTEEHHRFRIVFLLPEYISDPAKYAEIAKAFINKFQSDKSCKNIDRLYYGSKDAEYLVFGKQLKKSVLHRILGQADTEQKTLQSYERKMPDTITPDQVKEMLSYIPKRMAYDEWGKIVSAIGNTFDEHTAISLVDSWSPDDKVGTAYRIKHRSPKPTIASVVYYAKQNGYDTSSLFNKYSTVTVNDRGELVNKTTESIQYQLTELGNSERFADQYANKVRFNHTSGRWHIWNGRYWEEDRTNKIMQLAKKTIRNLYNEAKSIQQDTKKQELIKHALKSESKAQLQAMVALASSDQRIRCENSDFDSDVYLFNLKNGTYNLKTNEFLPHSPSNMLSKCAGVEYEPDADAICFEASLHTMFVTYENSQVFGLDTIKFVQKSLGLSLCGAHLEEALFFCHGAGKNGKSVFFNVIKMVFGDYFQKAPTEMLLLKNNDSIPNDVARLPGSRLVVAEELPDNRSFDENKIKNLTGGDQITARFMHKDYFDFKPTHTLWLYGNHKPRVKGTDEGIWRRLHMIPFTNTIPKEEQRPQAELMADFDLEKNGIFNWILEGWKLYLKEGLKPPENVVNATKEYRDEEDRLADFVAECCDLQPANKVIASDLLDAYLNWCNKTKEIPMPKNKFYRAIENREGISSERGTKNAKYLIGIDLNNNYREQPRAF